MNRKIKMNASEAPDTSHTSTATVLKPVPAVLVRFEEGQSCIRTEQEANLQNWIATSLQSSKTDDIVVGGAKKSSRAARLRRLNGLLHLLGRLGIAAKRVLTDVDWLTPTPMGTLDDMPADTVWLRVTKHTRHRTHSDHSKADQKLSLYPRER